MNLIIRFIVITYMIQSVKEYGAGCSFFVGKGIVRGSRACGNYNEFILISIKDRFFFLDFFLYQF